MCTLSLLFLSLLVLLDSLSVDGVSNNNAICDVIDSLACDNNPCDCSETDLNCQNCDNNNNNGCSQCITNYFRVDYDTKCVPCSSIDGCLHCTNNLGCQQCDTSQGCESQPIYNDVCGIYVCDCGDSTTDTTTTDNPTSSPSANPSMNPSPFPTASPSTAPSASPSMVPTAAPVTDEEYIDSGKDNAELFFTGVDCDTHIIVNYKENAYVCMTGFECYDLDTFKSKWCGICDDGILTNINDLISGEYDDEYSVTNKLFTGVFWRTCINSQIGTFFFNFMVTIISDPNTNEAERIYYSFRDVDDVVSNVNQIWSLR